MNLQFKIPYYPFEKVDVLSMRAQLKACLDILAKTSLSLRRSLFGWKDQQAQIRPLIELKT